MNLSNRGLKREYKRLEDTGSAYEWRGETKTKNPNGEFLVWQGLRKNETNRRAAMGGPPRKNRSSEREIGNRPRVIGTLGKKFLAENEAGRNRSSEQYLDKNLDRELKKDVVYKNSKLLQSGGSGRAWANQSPKNILRKPG